MSPTNAVLQKIEILNARARDNNDNAAGLEAAALAEGLALAEPALWYRHAALALRLRLTYDPASSSTSAAIAAVLVRIEREAFPSLGHKKLARRALAGVLREHESSLDGLAREWLATADVDPTAADWNRRSRSGPERRPGSHPPGSAGGRLTDP